jgi:hypothetical protein
MVSDRLNEQGTKDDQLIIRSPQKLRKAAIELLLLRRFHHLTVGTRIRS